MKLLVDCHCFDSTMNQGITSYIKGIYSVLPKINTTIDFYFVAEDIDKLRILFGIGQNIHYIQLISKNRLYRLFLEIPNIIKTYSIDVAHFQYVTPLIKNCKTIVTLHDVLFLDYPQFFPSLYKLSKNIPFKISAKKADLLCTVSSYSQERISYHYGIEQNKIIITPNAVDDEFYEINGGRPINFPQKYILYVSRIEPRKNHIDLVNSFLRLNLSKDGYKLVLIGKETVPTPQLHDLLNNLSPSDKESILLIPQVPFSELKLWYKYTDLFVYPSLAEGFGIPPLEAAAAKVPVICHNATAMSDFTFFGNNLINITDTEDLDQLILRNLKHIDPNREQRIAQYIKQKYNWGTIAKEFNNQLLRSFPY